MPNFPLRLIVFISALIGAPAAKATLILLSDIRTISVSGNDSSGYNASHTYTALQGVDFSTGMGVNGMYVSMQSTLSDSQISLATSSRTFLDASAYPADPVKGRYANASGDAYHAVTFRIDTPTMVHISGYRDMGLYGIWEHTLTSSSGSIPLTFTYPPFYLNYLDQYVTLMPDTYTFTGKTSIGTNVFGSISDGSHVRLELDLKVVNVPETASSIALLAMGCVVLIGARRLRL